MKPNSSGLLSSVALLLALLLAPAGARAQLITVDNVADGTVINTTYRAVGVLFGCLKGSRGSCADQAMAAATLKHPGDPAYSPPNVITVPSHSGYAPAFNEADGSARAQFLSPVSAVSIYAKAIKPTVYASTNKPYLQAFGANNQALVTVYYPAGAAMGTWQKLTIQRPTADIQYVVFSSTTTLTGAAVYAVFDNLAYAPVPPPQWMNIAAGTDFTVGLKTDGSLWTWGQNSRGQLGNGTTADANAPLHVGTAAWSAIAAGGNHVAAISTAGALYGWGENAKGEVGDSSFTDRAKPTQVGALHDWISVAAGADQTLGLRPGHSVYPDKGSLWAWGGNDMGQVGNNSTNPQTVPIELHIEPALAFGGGDSFSIASQGVLPPATSGAMTSAWGFNGFGQLSTGNTMNHIAPVPSLNAQQMILGSFDALSVGSGHVLALQNGTLFTWGLNSHGQLGNGSTTNLSYATQASVPSAVQRWTAVAAGGQHSVGIKADGTLWAWGWNASGQLGDGTTTDRPAPVPIGTDTHWVAVAAGFAHTLAIKSDGSLWAWGLNNHGQLGDHTATNRLVPTKISN
jgi:alpha-tubulin suppressor-like RCC1 family protein